jgi:hypothetical protein
MHLRKNTHVLVALFLLTSRHLNGQHSPQFLSLIAKEEHSAFQFDSDFVDQLIDPRTASKNRVKDITIWQYKEGSPAFRSTKHEYDSMGYCTRRFIFIIDHKELWKYDINHNVIELFDSARTEQNRHNTFTYFHDTRGRISKRLGYYFPDSCEFCNYKNEDYIASDTCRDTCLFQSLDFSYDGTDHLVQLVERVYLKDDHYEKLVFSYTYDTKGRLIQSNEHDTWRYYYRSNDSMKRCERIAPPDRVLETVVLKFDKKQRLVSKLNAQNDDWGEFEEYTYDEANLITRWTCYRGSRKDNFKRKLVFERRLSYSFY